MCKDMYDMIITMIDGEKVVTRLSEDCFNKINKDMKDTSLSYFHIGGRAFFKTCVKYVDTEIETIQE